MDPGLLLAAAGLIFAGIVKGAVGFGLPMIAAPVLAGYVGPRTAVVVMSIVNLVSAVLVAGRVRGVPLRGYLRLLGPIGLATVGGIVIGAQLLAVLPQALLSVLVGVVAMLFAVLSAARVQLKIRPERRGVVGSLIGLAAGLLGGTTSVLATPIVMYFQALGLPKRDFLVLLNVVLALSTLLQIVTYAGLGLFSGAILRSAFLTIACVGVGIGLGFVVQDRVNQRLFNKAVIAVIFLVGLSLVARTVIG